VLEAKTRNNNTKKKYPKLKIPPTFPKFAKVPPKFL
jgi:hypothetical protein